MIAEPTETTKSSTNQEVLEILSRFSLMVLFFEKIFDKRKHQFNINKIDF